MKILKFLSNSVSLFIIDCEITVIGVIDNINYECT